MDNNNEMLQEPQQFIAVSNISQDKLRKLINLEIHGLPCPSIQIKPFPTKRSELDNISSDDSLFLFGEISFVFNQQNVFGKHTTIPKNDATHQIYSGDAYTQVFPEITYLFDTKKLNSFRDRLRSFDNLPEAYTFDNYEQLLKVKQKNLSYMQEDFNKSITAKLAYLDETGILSDMKVFYMHDINPRNGRPEINKAKTGLLLKKLLKKAEKSSGYSFNDFLNYELRTFLHTPRIADNNKDATLENIVVWMKKNRGAGIEMTHSKSLNQLSASHKHLLRSYDHLVDKSSYILSANDYNKQMSSIQEKRSQVLDKSNDLYGDVFENLISATSYSPTQERILNFFKKNEMNIPTEELVNEIIDFIHMNNNSNHLYFEAKPNKPFYFKHRFELEDEKINYVVIPNDIDKKILDYLEKTDLKIIKYNPNKPNARLNALYRCKECFIKEEIKPEQKNKKKFKIK